MKPDNVKNLSDFNQIAELIEQSRNRAFQKVNEELILLYFRVGKIVSTKVSEGKWGENTVNQPAEFLSARIMGVGGFNRRGLYRMKQFYETYNSESECFTLWFGIQTKPTEIMSPVATLLEVPKIDASQIVPPVATQIQTADIVYDKFFSGLISQTSRTNHLEILSGSRTAEEKLFYMFFAVREKWSKLELRRQINSAMYERTMLAKNTTTKALTQIPNHLFKDPYVFEFLDLPENHSEKELEIALNLNLQKFILEIGKGFTYMGNQFRLQVGNTDYHTDLLFFHRDLQCLVMFELKVEEFKPEFIGKLNFYLEALDRDVKRPHENQSIGILLCKGKNDEVVEYSPARNTSPAIIADYETQLIPGNLLIGKLTQLIHQLSKDIE